MNKHRFSVALATIVCAAAGPAHAGLDGKTIGLGYEASGFSSTLDTITVGSGIEVSCPGSANLCSILTAPTQTLDFSDLSISYRYTGSGSAFNNLPVNGFRFLNLDLGPGLVIGGVQLATTITGLDMGRVSFTAHSVTMNMSDLALAGPQSGFDLTLVAAPVPEPASWAMMAGGLLGLGLLLARRRHSGPAGA